MINVEMFAEQRTAWKLTDDMMMTGLCIMWKDLQRNPLLENSQKKFSTWIPFNVRCFDCEGLNSMPSGGHTVAM